MRKHRAYAIHATTFLAAASLLSGCAHGPTLEIGLGFRQGPELSIQFHAHPITTNNSPAQVGAAETNLTSTALEVKL